MVAYIHTIWFVLFLGVISLCLVTLTTIVLLATKDLRRLCHQLNILLPHCDQAFQEARHTFGQARQFFKHTNNVVLDVEETVHKTSHATSELLDRLSHIKQKAFTLFKERFGNGRNGAKRPFKRKGGFSR